MKTILIIINGIVLPYHVIDYAIRMAKKNSCEILALFLKGTHEPSKGYGYPSDLPTTERWVSDKEAVRDDEEIIAENMKLVKQMIEDEKISFRSILKTNASIDEIKRISASVNLIVVDEAFDKTSLLGEDKILLKDLRNKISTRIDVIAAKKED